MSKLNLSLSIGLFVILASFAIYLTFNHTTQAVEPNPNQLTKKSTNVKKTVNQKPAKLSDKETELVNKIFSSRLLEIAAEYKSYARVDQVMRWSPLRCIAPPKFLENLARLSTSDSKETHGRKLYFLYSRKPWQYRVIIQNDKGKKVKTPIGQVLVKEAWHPIKEKALKGNRKPNKKRIYAVQGINKYYAGDKKGLFIMFKNKPDTPGTDQGWVYGTVSADGKKVTSVGLVNNCMQCHLDAPHDRQFGLPYGHTIPNSKESKSNSKK